MSLEEFAKEARRRTSAPVALHLDVEHLTGIIDGPPQPTASPVDHQTQFIEVPDIGARAPRALQSSGVLHAESPRASIISETSRKLTPKR